MADCKLFVPLGALALTCGIAAAHAAPMPARPVTERPAAACSAPAGFAEALRRALPITVGIYAVGRSSDPPAAVRLPMHAPANARAASEVAGEEGRIGAGFVLDRAGLIATAAHVVVGSRRIAVELSDRRVLPAELVGADEDSDIALLRVPAELPEPVLAPSSRLRGGDWVLAVGEPYGFSRSVAAGVVGGIDRHLQEEPELLFIQSDLSINPGNSGGPLLDASGAVVGMNSRNVISSYGAMGVSLSIPIEFVRQVADELLHPASKARPRLGASFQDVSPPAALAAGRPRATGALIGDVAAGSLAERMGLQSGDIVVGMNGRAIAGSADLAHALRRWRIAEGTRLTVWRDRGFLPLRLP